MGWRLWDVPWYVRFCKFQYAVNVLVLSASIRNAVYTYTGCICLCTAAVHSLMFLTFGPLCPWILCNVLYLRCCTSLPARVLPCVYCSHNCMFPVLLRVRLFVEIFPCFLCSYDRERPFCPALMRMKWKVGC